MTLQIWFNIASGNGLLPYGSKPLPEPVLTSRVRWYSPKSHFTASAVATILNNGLVNCTFKFQPNLPGTNELAATFEQHLINTLYHYWGNVLRVLMGFSERVAHLEAACALLFRIYNMLMQHQIFWNNSKRIRKPNTTRTIAYYHLVITKMYWIFNWITLFVSKRHVGNARCSCISAVIRLDYKV